MDDRGGVSRPLLVRTNERHTCQKRTSKKHLPSAEEIAKEMAKVESPDDFFGKEGVFSRLFSKTMEEMLEAEMDEHLGYEKHSSAGWNSGNSRNGSYSKKVRTSVGDQQLHVPRDRGGTFSSGVLKKYQTSSNEIEDKIVSMYARGMTTRDIQDTLQEMYGVELSAAGISNVTDRVWALVEEWHNRPLDKVYPVVFLDAIHLKIRLEGKTTTTACYVILAVTMSGHTDVLGHWIGDGAEGANFWLSVLTDLKNRGVEDIFIASVDGLSGFSEAIASVYPQTQVQRCVVHQIRNSLRYVSWKNKKVFTSDLKCIYKAATKEEAEKYLIQLEDTWGKQYPIATKSWRANWQELSTFFQYTPEIRKLIYTTNAIESYNRQLRKVTKTESIFPNPDAARKMLYLAHHNIAKKWTKPRQNWQLLLNQLAIHFEGRFEI